MAPALAQPGLRRVLLLSVMWWRWTRPFSLQKGDQESDKLDWNGLRNARCRATSALHCTHSPLNIAVTLVITGNSLWVTALRGVSRFKEMSENNGNKSFTGTSLRLKVGLAEMLKGGVIMDVMNVEQARIAEEAGAASVMALERVPAMIRAEGGVARMANVKLIKGIIEAVSIPVMAKARIGHFAEAQILQEIGVDFIDESEVLTPADETHHIDKHAFTTPFVCGARNLGEALRRIAEGAAMIRTKGEAGTGDVVHAVQHMRQIVKEMKALTVLSEQELYAAAKEHQAPYELIRMVAQAGKLPVPNFSAGGIATPADAALMMQLGAEAIFVGSGIFMKERATPLDVENNAKEREEAVSRAKAIVIATTHFNDPKVLAEVSEQVTGTMKGLAASAIEESQLLQTRGW
jgi:pyridoxal 5'-phosphate synthase pdxS subunit